MNLWDWIKSILGKKKEPELVPLAPIIKKIDIKKRAKKAKKATESISNTVVAEEVITSVVDKVESVVVVVPEKEPEVKEEKPKKQKKPKKEKKPKEDVSLLWTQATGTPAIVEDSKDAVWVSKDKPTETPPVPEVSANTEVVQEVANTIPEVVKRGTKPFSKRKGKKKDE